MTGQRFSTSDSNTPRTDTLRVAAVQFATGTDVDANLATCLRMIDRAAAESPDLVVLPEFSNHLSVYESADHCWEVAVDLDGPFLRAIGERAAEHGFHVVVTVTVRRNKPAATVTNCWFDPSGALVATADKQVLMGAEREYLSTGSVVGPIIDSRFGPVAMYSCMEGVVPETPRSLALGGARLLTNSLNSFALDEAALHIPVRAAENGVFVVAANKVGPLIPENRVGEYAAAMGLPEEAFHGAGESQVVAPDGTVLAKGPLRGEAVVLADIDLTATADRSAAGGTDRIADRRPEVYGPLGTEGASEVVGSGSPIRAVALASDGERAIAETGSAAEGGAALVVLPELAADVDDLRQALAGSETVAVTSVRDGDRHRTVVVGSDGVLAESKPMHRSARHPWATELADEVLTVDLGWGRLAVVAGDDALFPEPFRLAAVAGASVVAVPTHLEDPWLVDLGIAERSGESRLNLVVGTREAAGGPVIAALPPDFTLWMPSREREFDGTINTPDLHLAVDGVATAEIVPARAANKNVSRGTDLVGGRPMAAARALAANST